MRNMLVAAVSALMVFCVHPAFADISECLQIENDLDRLGCFDRESGISPHVEIKHGTGKWVTKIEKSKFKDTTDVYLQLGSTNSLSCSRAGAESSATLLLMCRENTTEMYITTACHLTSGHGGYGRVDIRLDDEKSFTSDMTASTNNKALGLSGGRQSIPIVKKMIGKNIMLTRFTPFGESSVTAEFLISGLSDAIVPLRESCGW